MNINIHIENVTIVFQKEEENISWIEKDTTVDLLKFKKNVSSEKKLQKQQTERKQYKTPISEEKSAEVINSKNIIQKDDNWNYTEDFKVHVVKYYDDTMASKAAVARRFFVPIEELEQRIKYYWLDNEE